ncbi:MAG TPA: bifunctional 4-hydroxy-2-oxoglutarate aldolase/2-dehydro-3-deoxy-phosphogluconate aldolase, partial [Oscillatoriaceae cyanobacterium]
ALARLVAARFVPVLRASDPMRALAAAHALIAGGCVTVEIAFTTPEAAEVIRALAATGLLVGAGTVLDVAQAEAAHAAGARYLVSPVTDPELLDWAAAHDVLFIPGALTPGEVVVAMRSGARVVKVFPVDSVGGPRYLARLREPLPDARFFPTGGITLDEAPAYLAAGAIAVGVGGALIEPAAIVSGDLARLTERARAWCDRLSPTIP